MAGLLLRYPQSLLSRVGTVFSGAHTAAGLRVPLSLHRAAHCQSKVLLVFDLLLPEVPSYKNVQSLDDCGGAKLPAQLCASDCKCVCAYMYMCMYVCRHARVHTSVNCFVSCYPASFMTFRS